MPDEATPSTTPGAIASGLSVASEPGLGWFHRFGPLAAVVALFAAQAAEEMGYIPDVPALGLLQAALVLLSGGWAARLGMTPPKT